MNLTAAILYSAALVFGSPFIGQIRAAILRAFPTDFVRVVASLIVIIVGAGFVVALVRASDRRAVRAALLAAALGLGVLVARLVRTGYADVDVVERFHFVQYGLLTVLFYRVWRKRQDAASYVLPLVAGLLVGTLDEWFQWFVPSRVGEFHDVLLDVVACVCGLLFSAAFEPPRSIASVFALRPGARARIGALAALATLVFALFFQSVHLGYVVPGPDGSTFRSTYSAGQLAAVSQERAVRWRVAPPVEPRLLSQEDQYFGEALWHVNRRNGAWATDDVFTAWEENRILETFFMPALTTRSFYSVAGFKWPDSQRKDAESRAAGSHPPYVSDAEPYPIRTWPKSMYWAVVMALIAVFVLVGREARTARPL